MCIAISLGCTAVASLQRIHSFSYHLAHEIEKLDLGAPAELVPNFRWVRLGKVAVDLTDQQSVNFHVVGPVKVYGLESSFTELRNRVRLTGANNEIRWHFVSQYQMHCFCEIARK